VIKKLILIPTILILSLYLSVVATLPKEGIWYEFEKRGFEKGLIINGEKLDNSPLSLSVSDGEIIFKSMSVANFKNLELTPLLLFNRVDISDIEMGKDLSQFGEFKIDSLSISHIAISPEKVTFKSEGNFGTLKGRFTIDDKKLDILLFPSDKLKKERAIMKNFKINRDVGGYEYHDQF
jgi:hypothetical protein